MSAFGAFLDQKMKEREWNGVRLEAESGVSDANISRWIKKGGRPIPANVVLLARAFGEDPAEWMRMAGYPVGDPSEPLEAEKELLTQVRSFPWLQELVPDILSLSPPNQRVVQLLVASLHQEEGGGDDAAQ